MTDTTWIDAAKYEFDLLGEPADDQAIERLAAHIEELASLNPANRMDYVNDFVGAERDAMISWINDSWD